MENCILSMFNDANLRPKKVNNMFLYRPLQKMDTNHFIFKLQNPEALFHGVSSCRAKRVTAAVERTGARCPATSAEEEAPAAAVHGRE